MANYPADEPDHRRSHRPPPMPSSNRYLPPLNREPGTQPRREPPRAGSSSGERVTVTRAAAQRSREMGSRMYSMVHRAATADGADKSGLTALTWPVVANFATDAAIPDTWECPRCGNPAGQNEQAPPNPPRVEPYKTHLAYVKERRSDSDGEAILAEALARLRGA